MTYKKDSKTKKECYKCYKYDESIENTGVKGCNTLVTLL